MDKLGACSFFLTTLLLISSTSAVDKTIENEASGSTVVEAVVNLLRARCTVSDDNFFLRRMAYAASRDGEKSDTFRKGFDGGIWQIDKQKFTITQTSKVLGNQRRGIQGNFSIDWSSVTWSDLRKPLYSGIAAALYLQYIERMHATTIPTSINAQAKFWVDRFNGQLNDFLAVQNLQEVSCDMKAVDLVFVVDESGSIGSSNFDRIKDFLSDLVDQLTITSTAFHVGLVKFNKRAITEFHLDQYSQKYYIKSAIKSMTYNKGSTRIAAGIRTGSTLFASSSRRNSTKVMILLTDGRSSDRTETAREAQRAKAEGMTIFVIGIGNVDPQEITSTASQPTCVHVFLLQQFSSIDNILYEVRRRSCKAPTKVEIVNEEEAKVVGELLPNRTVEDTVEIDSKTPSTKITTEVVCGEVELFASSTTTSPSEALYEVKGLARDHQPASFSIQNGGQTVYVYYKGKIVSVTEDCRNRNKTFSISFTQASDSCKSSPCENGGTCVDQLTGFTCHCITGFDGNRCQNNIDECQNNPCANGGSCVDMVNGYMCVCVSGYSGSSCEINMNKCASSPCQNGGSCSNVNNDFVCSCSQGFRGKSCEINIDDCLSSVCLNGGLCKDLVNDFTCQCMPGFSGKTCNVDIDDCSPNPCKNGGSCGDLVNDFRCSCSSGYTGKECEVIIDHCQTSPCRNAGTCVNSVSGYSCDCQNGYTGKNCESEATLVMCRIGSVEKECTIEDLQKTGFADHLCTGANSGSENSGSQTPENPTPSVPDASGTSASSVCVPKGHVYHIPYPGDKAKYIQCDEYGGSTVMPCAPGTEFNAPRQICTSNTVCPPEKIITVPHSTDPGKYYNCVYGTAHLMSCPGTLVFNADLKICTWSSRRREFEKDSGKSETKNKMAGGDDDDEEEENVEEEETNDVTDVNLDEDLEDELKERREKNDKKQRNIEELREALRKILGDKIYM